MARTTMSTLISTLRGMAAAGTADYTIGATAYWSDDQLQAVLDRFQFSIREEDLTSYERTAGDGTSEWFEYQSGWRWLEDSDGGTARLYIQDGAGSIISGTTYAVDEARGLVTFTADQGGSTRALTGFAYDIYGAAADVWLQKGAQYATAIDFSTDNHSVKRGHISAQCNAMAKHYQGLSATPYEGQNNGGGFTIIRSDSA